jgi:peptidyl-prolyl cis-trans isomerase C
VIRLKQFCQSALIVLALVVALSGCSPKRAGQVLARVGDEVITTDDFKKEVQWRLDHNRPLPDKAALLDEMVAREISLQKAKALGLETNFDIQHNYREMLVGGLKDHELTPKVEAVKVSAEEIKAAYDRDIAQYTKPAKTRLALVYMKLDRKANAEQKEAVEARMVEAEKATKSLTDFAHGFGAVAMNFSEDQASRYRGGDVGWFDASEPLFRWPKEVVQAGMSLQQNGRVTPIVRTSTGLYLVMKTDYRDAAVTPLANVSASIQRRLLEEKKEQVAQTFTKDLRAAARVQTDAITLSQIDYPTTTVAQVEEKLPPALPRSQ